MGGTSPSPEQSAAQDGICDERPPKSLRLKRSGLSHERWKYVEGELYSFEYTKSELAELRASIEGLGSVSFVTPRAEHTLRSPTEERAITVLTNKAIVYMTRTISQIERAFERLGPEYRKLYWLWYRQCRTWGEICLEMNISEAVCFRRRRKLVLMVAWEMGLTSETPTLED
jgi:RinA family phage transcriptional activator